LTAARELRDRLGVGLAAVVAATGWALTILDLVRGGGYAATAVGLVPGLPLGVIGTVTVLAVWKRSVNIAVWLAAVVATGILVNLLLYWLKLGKGTWAGLVPPDPLWGRDFRDGLYDPARAFSVARSGWPPLTLLVGWPFTLLKLSSAYAIQVALTACAAVAAAVLGSLLAVKAVRPPDSPRLPGEPQRVDAVSLGVVFGVWLLTSYGFLYELQRGNVDVFALVFSLLAVWAAIRLPRSPWWPAIALALAINLKVYPAILLVLLFWRYRLRALVPVLVTNAVLMLIAGPANFWRFVTWVTTVAPAPRRAVFGDMGVSATAAVLRQNTGWAPSWVAAPLYLVPLALWGATGVILLRRGWNDRGAVMLAASCVPLMAVVPALSNEYKLVLFVFPLLVLAAVIGGSGAERGRLTWCLAFGVLGWLILFLARSSVTHAAGLLGSKYSLAVILQALLLFTIVWLDRSAPGQEGMATREIDRKVIT
jgi:hypothetical protein